MILSVEEFTFVTAFFVLFFETGSRCCVAQGGLELEIDCHIPCVVAFIEQI
jgi:hypothetical protein